MTNYTVINNDVITCLSPRALQVYFVLSSMCYGNKTECFPSQQTLSLKLHCSVRTIQRAIKQLVQAGYIKVKHRFATTNLYSILHKVVNAAVNTVAEKAKQFKKGFEKKEKKFNNFENRKYDPDELEKQLIERSRNCLL